MRTRLATTTRQLDATKALLKSTKAQLATQLADLRRLHDLGVKLSSHLQLPTLLDEVLRAVCALQRAPMGLLMLYDPDLRDLGVAASAGLDPESVTRVARIPPGKGPCGLAISERTPLVVRDLAGDKRFEADRAFMAATGARAMCCFPLQARTGQIVGAIATYFRTARRPTAREIQLVELYGGQASEFIENARQYQEIREASRLKDEFLATISHEIRTPLNAVLGWTRVLQMTGTLPSDDQGARALRAIERNSRIQAQLVEDLLDISRIVAGKMQLTFEPVNLAATVEAALETVRPAADNKRIELRSDLASDIIVFGDPARLQQVVWNLVVNAVRFTPEGGWIEARVERSGTSARLTISDSGVGIAPALLPHVFDRFRQGDGSTTQSHRGLGLGLAIVRHVVEGHGGSVRADSPGLGQGATFTVALPVSSGSEVAERPRIEPRRDAISVDGVRILLVEDEADSRELLATVLETYGAKVTAVASGVEALAALQQAEHDVLIADIGMADMNGYALIRAIRTLTKHADRRLPAIALTVYASAKERDEAIAAGYDRHVVKPIDPERVAQTVAELLTDWSLPDGRPSALVPDRMA
jgi:signal transduction histidine kinase/ActR/RegA family two-component response regulator